MDNVEVSCGEDNGVGHIGLRISSIFVVGIGSLLGALLPVFLNRTKHAQNDKMKTAFFIVKYFGSGVIIGTAFIHLLAPATEALQSPCLKGTITEYSWAEAIALMTVFTMFFIEILAARTEFLAGGDHQSDIELAKDPSRGVTRYTEEDQTKGRDRDLSQYKICYPSHNRLRCRSRDKHGTGIAFHTMAASNLSENKLTQSLDERNIIPNRSDSQGDDATEVDVPVACTTPPDNDFSYPPGGADHLGHQREHDKDDETALVVAQLTSIFILEFGVIFHSVFIGLTLAVAGSNFTILYIVLAFHQTFEGLGLGTRLALTPWPRSKEKWLPWVLGTAFGFTTPIAIAIGIGIRSGFKPGEPKTMIIQGIFDSISAGILIYTGLVELMAHEFMFNEEMRNESLKKTLFAFGCMCFGAGLMALLGKWA